MKNVRGDVFIVASDKPSRHFVEHNQARRVGRAVALVRVIDSGSRVEVKIVAVDEN